jgi:hypothetical protein
VSRDQVTPDQLRRLVRGEPVTDRRGRVLASRSSTSKFYNRRAYLPAIDRWFASERERDRAAELLVRQQRGEIRGLRFQVPVDLAVNGVHVCRYVADFMWSEWAGPAGWQTVVADAKGYRTDTYKLKKALLFALHGIAIREL